MSKLQNSQLDNFKTYQLYLREMIGLAENVFKYDNIPDYIDISFMNKSLVKKGAIAFFYDDILKTMLALPFSKFGALDVYGRFTTIQVYGANGYTNILKPEEYVIMYDNYYKYPIFIDICQYAERIALYERISDINIMQQKTPRIWQTSTDKERTLKDLLNNIDGNVETILAYDNLLDKVNSVLQPAPYIADKITEKKEKMWNEFLRFIGIANITVQKKERNIKDEIMASQGGTIASRFARFESRKKAIDMINKKFAEYLEKPIVVSFYDNLPTNLKDIEDEVKESEVDQDDIISDNTDSE